MIDGQRVGDFNLSAVDVHVGRRVSAGPATVDADAEVAACGHEVCPVVGDVDGVRGRGGAERGRGRAVGGRGAVVQVHGLRVAARVAYLNVHGHVGHNSVRWYLREIESTHINVVARGGCATIGNGRIGSRVAVSIHVRCIGHGQVVGTRQIIS